MLEEEWKAHLYHNATLVVSENQLIGSLRITKSPDALHAVVESLLHAVSVGVPQPGEGARSVALHERETREGWQPEGAILGASNDERESWVEAGDRHVVGMTLQ